MAFHNSGKKALHRLQAGNKRFALEMHRLKNQTSLEDKSGRDRRLSLLDGQSPFAIILGCADSRVPAEIVFDQGLGDLFVIRIAGNIIAPSLVESVEFSAKRHGARLVVVLGHTHCGAIEATFESILQNPKEYHGPYSSIIERIRPSFNNLLATHFETQDTTPPLKDWDQDKKNLLLQHATRANIKTTVNHLRYNSHILKELGKSAGLLIVGAEYSLETGLVDFFD